MILYKISTVLTCHYYYQNMPLKSLPDLKLFFHKSTKTFVIDTKYDNHYQMLKRMDKTIFTILPRLLSYRPLSNY